jgi:hypothetical protein
MIDSENGDWPCRLLSLVALSGATLLPCASAQAQDSVAAFYRGRTISINIGFPPEGSYDIYSRLPATHMGKYIPGTPSSSSPRFAGSSTRSRRAAHSGAPIFR